MARSGPTLRSQWLGQQLRQLREDADMGLRQAAEHLERDVSTISRYESGETPLRRVDLMALLDLYGVSDRNLRDHVEGLRNEAWQTGWWDGWQDVIDRQFVDYTWLETRAHRERAYESMLVAGLLQTPAYAEAVIRKKESDASDEQVERYVSLRMQRQKVWAEDPGKSLSVILDESVLYRQVGGPDVLQEQLRRLVEASERDDVELRILPFSVGGHAGQDGSFLIIDPGDPYPEVAYVETLSGSVFAEAGRVDAFDLAYAQLESDSLEPSDSRHAIEQAMKGRKP